MKKPILNRGTFVSFAYVFASLLLWGSGEAPRMVAAAAGGYSFATLSSGSFGFSLLLSIVLFVVVIPAVYLCFVLWIATAFGALLIFIRRMLGRVPSRIEPHFWTVVGWMALTLICGLYVFNYAARLPMNPDPGAVEADLGSPAQLFELLAIMILARIGVSGQRDDPWILLQQANDRADPAADPGPPR